MSPKTDERKFIPLHKVIKVFVSRSRGEISGWRGRSLGGLVFHRFPSCVFYVTWKIVVEPWQNMTAKNHSLNLFYHDRNCDCIVQLWRWNTATFPTNIININLILNFSFQKFLYIIIIKLICSNTNDTYLINTKDKILWIWLYKFVYKRVKRFRFFLLISLSYLYVESQCVSRVTCLSLDYNFESSILFALFPDFPTSLPHCAHHLRIHAQTESNHTPFYPALSIH